MNSTGSKNPVMLFIGTLFGAGYLPIAPGTWGSFLFLPFIFASYLLFDYSGIIALTLLACLMSLATAPAAIRHLGNDPGAFVMDECAGQALVFAIVLPLFGLYPNILILFAGFVLFRLFDIIKPIGIKRMEKFRGKYGILADDLIAGFYASVSLTAIIYTFSLI